jgi:hypothetical protein
VQVSAITTNQAAIITIYQLSRKDERGCGRWGTECRPEHFAVATSFPRCKMSAGEQEISHNRYKNGRRRALR